MTFLALALAFAAALQAQPDRVLELEKHVTIEQCGTLRNLLDLLRLETGATIHVDPSTAHDVDPDRQVDLRLRDVSGWTALRWITRLFGLRFLVRNGIPVVHPPGRLAESFVRRTYPVHVAGAEILDRPGGRLEPAPPPAAGFQIAAEPAAPAPGDAVACSFNEFLIDLLKENVAPGTWEGSQTLECDLQGRLLAHCLPETHEQIRWFLDALARIPSSNVTVRVTVAPGDDPALPRIVKPDEVDAALRTLRSNPSFDLEVSGLNTQRVHSLSRREGSDAALLDARGTLVDLGRSVLVELRLSLGESSGDDRLLTRLATSVTVPNGGGALLSLPSRDGKPRLCLVRASAPVPPALDPFLLSPDPRDAAVAAALAMAPPADLDLEDAPLSHLADWLRRVAGLNVLVGRSSDDPRLTFHGKRVAPARVLPVLLDGIRHAAFPRDGALLLAPDRFAVRTAFIDARDALRAADDFDRLPRESSACTFDDLANLVKNTVRRDEWEEADGKSIMVHRGFLILRNREPVLREVAAFVDERRTAPLRRVALRAEICDAPADEVERITANRAARTLEVDAAQRDLILKAGTRLERLAWISFDRQHTFLDWNDSFLSIKPSLDQGVQVAFEDRRDADQVSLRTRVEIPSDGTGLFRFPLPAAGGGERRVRVLLLSLAAIP